MKLFRHQDVGLTITAELAASGGDCPMSLSVIADRHGMSVFYLKKIARALREHGIIVSREGLGGGYLLAHSSTLITVWDVIIAVDSGITLREYENQTRDACPHNKACLPRIIRHSVAQALKTTLEKITIADLILEAGK